MKFDKLTLNQKMDLINNKGRHLATGEYYNHKINLYSLNGRLYEVWYNVEGNKITDIKEMVDGRIFRKYIQEN